MSDALSLILGAIERLEAGQAKLEAGQANLEAGQAKLEAGQAKLEASQAKLEASQAKLEAGQAKLEASQAKLQDGLTEVRDGLTDVHTRQVELSEELKHVRGAVMARIDRLQDALNQQRDDALVTYSRIDRLEKPMREKIEGIEREISAMYIQIRNLQTDVRLIRGDH